MYENRVVAFIDILNFKNKINATEDIDDPKAKIQLEKLIHVLEYIQKGFDNILKTNQTAFQVTMFSDSVVFSVKETDSITFISIIEILKHLQINLIKDGILLRGGIVYGKIIHDERKIIGPALIDAYELEGKSALYPRIVIDPDILKTDTNITESTAGLFNVSDFLNKQLIQEDFDGTYYVDYFSDASAHIEQGTSEDHYSTLRKLIHNGLKSPNIGIRIKYLWMLQKFNNHKPLKTSKMVSKRAGEIPGFDSWSMYHLGGSVKNFNSIKDAITYISLYFGKHGVKQYSGGVKDDFTFSFQVLMQRPELYKNLLNDLMNDPNIQFRGYTHIV